jgi:hypothetical protein
MHCLQEWSSKAHLGHFSGISAIAGNTVPHCEQRETVRLPAICKGRGPNVSFLTGLSPDLSPDFCDFSPLS